MTDAHLRELERRFRASGSREDMAAWLQARVRTAELDTDRQRLLAYLGCPVPGRVYEPPPARTPHELGGWVHGLPHDEPLPWAVEIHWRVGAALARTIPEGELSEAETAARLLDRWIVETRDSLTRESLAAEVVVLQDDLGTRFKALWPHARRQRRLLGGLVLALDPARSPGAAMNAMVSKATEFLAEELGVGSVQEALLGELVPWALGHDPVRERVEARRRGGRP